MQLVSKPLQRISTMAEIDDLGLAMAMLEMGADTEVTESPQPTPPVVPFSHLEQCIIAEASMPGMDAFHVINTKQFEWVPMVESFFPTLPPLKDPKANLGKIEKCPDEIILQITPHMTIGSAVSFRQVNRRARQLVDVNREYQLLVYNAMEFVQMFLRTGVADHYPMKRLWYMLHDDECSTKHCKRISNLLDLAGRERICTNCFSHYAVHVDFGIRSLGAVSYILNISQEELKKHYSVAIITAVPGIYSERLYKQSKCRDLVSTKVLAAELAMVKEEETGINRRAHQNKLIKALAKAPYDYAWKYMTVMEMPFLQPHTVPNDRVYTCRYCPKPSFTADQLFWHTFECDFGTAYIWVLFEDPDDAVFVDTDQEKQELAEELFGRRLVV